MSRERVVWAIGRMMEAVGPDDTPSPDSLDGCTEPRTGEILVSMRKNLMGTGTGCLQTRNLPLVRVFY